MGALMVMEVSKKQHYIFKSRKLKDQIGASAIIRYVTEELFKQSDCDISSFGGSLIFKGGGKSLFEFNDLNYAKKFVEMYSKLILVEYPGIELFMSCIEYNHNEDKLVEAIGNLFERLAHKKQERINAFCQVDFGVNLVCRESKLPANYKNFKGRSNISRETAKKIEFALNFKNNNRVKSNFFQDLLPSDCNYIDNFDINEQSNKNMVAIVHIDGNNMGQRVLAIKNDYIDKPPSMNQDYINALNTFSKGVDTAYILAFKKMLVSIKNKIKDLEQAIDIISLPIRPLILAGDDICYICRGDIGIESARIFLEELYKQKDTTGKAYTGCAGIAIVKSKYPFFKGYYLAEDLCSQAKKVIAINKIDASAIDWHINFGELSNDISEIRESDYKSDEETSYKLYRRPYIIDSTISGRNSNVFYYSDFKDSKLIIDRVEADSRGLLKSFRNAIKTGPEATKSFFTIHKDLTKKMHEDEFEKNSSRSFDAIEIMDVFTNLEVDNEL